MNILIVNATDTLGGAAIAAYRLHAALLAQNINSQILVQNKQGDNFTVLETSTYLKKEIDKARKILDQVPLLFYKNKTTTPFSPSWFPFSNLSKKINELNPDIVHLHWVNRGMLHIEDFIKINAPIIWTLHDNWVFTGGCHIMWKCEKYKKNCGACPLLGSSNANDLSRKIFKRKEKIFSKVTNMTITAPSNWLKNCAEKSTLLKNNTIIKLPNLIDITLFKPFNYLISRELWSLSKSKKLILFGAMNSTSDINKGYKELTEALLKVKSHNIELIIFGSSKPQKPDNFPFKTTYIGTLHDEVSLVTLYNAVDVMVVPSRQEAFGQTASEAQACGTPVVAFSHTGLLDIVEHQVTGYLAKPFDTSDFANGIDWVINSTNYDDLCHNARRKTIEQFDSQKVVQEYIKLYNKITIECISKSNK